MTPRLWLATPFLLTLFVFSAFAGPALASNGGAVTPIQHVIVVMQENHSFDNYFGTYPTANGSLADPITSQLEDVNGIPNGVCLAYGGGCVSPQPARNSSSSDPVEGQVAYEKDVNNGGMNGFPSSSGPQSMLYYDYHQIPAYWDYAEEYGIGDNYFSSALSNTLPNRLMTIEGDSQFPETGVLSPGFFTSLYNQLSQSFSSTIFYQLSAAGVSWGYYDFFSSPPFSSNAPFGLGTDVQNLSSFYGDLSSGSGLPQVSFVNALGSFGLTEHPPDNVTAGEQWVVSVVNALERSSYWQSSALFLTWDEGGGFYDHAPPPQALSIDHSFATPLLGYGMRVPLIVISPYSKENYVSKTVLNHMSLLKFVDYDFNLAPLNQYVANSNNLLDFFDFNQTGRAPIVLGASGQYSMNAYPIPLQTPLSSLPYPRTGSYSGSEGTQQSPTSQGVLSQFEGIFTGTDQLLNNLLSNNMSAITVDQVYSLVYLVVLIVVILLIVSVARRVGRRKKGSPAPPREPAAS